MLLVCKVSGIHVNSLIDQHHLLCRLQSGVVLRARGEISRQAIPSTASTRTPSNPQSFSYEPGNKHQTMTAFALQSTIDARDLPPSGQHLRYRRASTGSVTHGVFGDNSEFEFESGPSLLSEAKRGSALARSSSSTAGNESISAWNRLVRFQALKPKDQDQKGEIGSGLEQQADQIGAHRRQSPFLLGRLGKMAA